MTLRQIDIYLQARAMSGDQIVAVLKRHGVIIEEKEGIGARYFADHLDPESAWEDARAQFWFGVAVGLVLAEQGAADG